MPEIKYYEVEETRTVKVQANSAVDASRIAAAAFANGQNSDNGTVRGPEDVWGNTIGRIEITNLNVSKEL